MTDQHFEFEVTSSSSGEVYRIVFHRSGKNLTCSCTCKAGAMGTHCKHRVGILMGDAGIVSGGDVDMVSEVPKLVAGTDVEAALSAFIDADRRKTAADRDLSAAKKALARAMAD